jgi:hypothetical protein
MQVTQVEQCRDLCLSSLRVDSQIVDLLPKDRQLSITAKFASDFSFVFTLLLFIPC